MNNRENFLVVEFAVELPIAAISLLFFKTVRWGLRTLTRLSRGSANKIEYKWLLFSGEFLQKPLVLTSLLTTGPRWNPHVIAAGAGPFEVYHSVAIDIDSCVASSPSWSIGIYRFPEAKAVEYIASHDSNLQKPWHKLTLEPGQYTLGLRYYHWLDDLNLPSVQVDGYSLIERQAIKSSHVNDHFQTLATRDNLFYRGLNFYIFTLLLGQKWLPTAWVKQEYLPVGDPNNEFLYGVVYQNYWLKLEFHPYLLDQYEVYLTIYNRSSLPIFFTQIEKEDYRTSVMEDDGFYLVRLRPHVHPPSSLLPDWISINLQNR